MTHLDLLIARERNNYKKKSHYENSMILQTKWPNRSKLSQSLHADTSNFSQRLDEYERDIRSCL